MEKQHASVPATGAPVTQETKNEWKEKYTKRILETSNFTEADAEAIFEGGGAGTEIDFSEDPVKAADRDMSYWCD